MPVIPATPLEGVDLPASRWMVLGSRAQVVKKVWDDLGAE
jgi:hypothetical protein